ncbi:MAG: universal stress protein [Bacteroidota bacterium]
MKRILVPIDFSAPSEDAFRYALQMAEALGAELEVMHVFHPTPSATDLAMQHDFDYLQNEVGKRLDAFVKRQCKKADPNNLVIRQRVTVGFAAEAIVKASKSQAIDFIVLGTRRERHFMDRLFGTVTSFVANNTACPLLIVPEGVDRFAMRRILYATKYDPSDEEVIREVIDFASHFDAELQLVHVHTAKDESLELLRQPHHAPPQPESEDTAVAIPIHSVSSPSVWTGLLEEAETELADLIVLVNHRRRFWNQLLHKSVTREMVLRARFPFMVFHLEDDA